MLDSHPGVKGGVVGGGQRGRVAALRSGIGERLRGGGETGIAGQDEGLHDLGIVGAGRGGRHERKGQGQHPHLQALQKGDQRVAVGVRQ